MGILPPLCREPGSPYDEYHIKQSKKGGYNQACHPQHSQTPCLCGSRPKHKLAHKARKERDPHQPQPGQGKTGHGNRHGPSHSPQFIHIFPSPFIQDGSRAEEQGNLHQGVAYHMGQACCQPRGSHKHDAHKDIGQLAYSRIGQPAFQMLCAKGPEGAIKDGDAADAQNRCLHLCPYKESGPEAPVHHPHQRKHAPLHHCHCVQKG